MSEAVQKGYDIRVQKIMLLKQDIFHAGHLLALENHVAYFFPSPYSLLAAIYIASQKKRPRLRLPETSKYCKLLRVNHMLLKSAKCVMPDMTGTSEKKPGNSKDLI